ncbi:MAG: bifunctional phosphopantothenoylcysteine decarboxylase/phosphopantothenate--cysteine ligase CoaBC [Acidobacteria bacterium]|nr:bifunctional phosphopantothenoylcysteine decarboxylase/phosphopantothenate--cysteine ligase CoaBC [Acidobacteriota bacterium]
MTELAQAEGALRGARVLLGVSGGIACYKAVEVARLLSRAGARVQVVMTEAATRFVGTVTFAALTHRPVYTGVFEAEDQVLHLRLAREADLVLLAPATANLVAKMAAGLADDLLSATLLTARCPVVAAPAMHTEMWEHPATRANVRLLRERGIVVVEPAEGELAGGDEGVGRLPEPRCIVTAAAEALARDHDLRGVPIVVTAGGTREPIDAIRFIGNRSSGKMGFAVAAEAARRGAQVTLVTGPTFLEPPPGVDVVRVETAEEMRREVLARFPRAEVVVKAAAVSDFRASAPVAGKIRKEDAPPGIALERTPDILAELGRTKSGQVLVGFSAETTEHVPRGRKKLAAKNLDLVVVNHVGAPDSGFDSDTNRAILITADGEEAELPLLTKSSLAREILDRVVRMVEGRRGRAARGGSGSAPPSGA